jgi:DNA-directed RNA polymerase specialized sigma24 family protein
VSLFPPTRHSVLDDLRGTDAGRRRAAQEALALAYLQPVQTYLALRWRRSGEEARDLTQEFFRSVAERGLLEAYDPARARLRTYLRLCVDALVRNLDLAGRREKRGGGAVAVPLDDVPEAVAAESPEALFEREWRRSIFSLAVDRTRSELLAQGKQQHWAVLEGFDLGRLDGARPSYAELAGRLGISVTDVTNRLSQARRVLRARTLEVLREFTLDEAEFREEARALLGVEVR